MPLEPRKPLRTKSKPLPFAEPIEKQHLTPPDRPVTGKPFSAPKGSLVKRVRVQNRYLDLLEGRISMDDLDEEEIMRGQLRDKNGTFRGRPPLMVPREMGMELARRQREYVQGELAGMLVNSLRTIQSLHNSSEISGNDATRMNAARFVVERVLGKVPEKLEMKAEISRWEAAVEASLIPMSEIEANPEVDDL